MKRYVKLSLIFVVALTSAFCSGSSDIDQTQQTSNSDSRQTDNLQTRTQAAEACNEEEVCVTCDTESETCYEDCQGRCEEEGKENCASLCEECCAGGDGGGSDGGGSDGGGSDGGSSSWNVSFSKVFQAAPKTGQAVVGADFDGDSDRDFFFAGDGGFAGDHHGYWINDGNLSFTTCTFNSTISARGLAVGNFVTTSDGPDVFVAAEGNDHIWVNKTATNSGCANAFEKKQVSWGHSSEKNWDAAAVNFDGLGADEIAVVNDNDGLHNGSNGRGYLLFNPIVGASGDVNFGGGKATVEVKIQDTSPETEGETSETQPAETATTSTDLTGPHIASVSSDVGTINETSLNEVSFTITTENVPEGSSVDYRIGGAVTVEDFETDSLSGKATVAGDGSATVSVTASADETVEGAETFDFTAELPEVSKEFFSGASAATVAFGDLDQDHDSDLAVGGSEQLWIYLNEGGSLPESRSARYVGYTHAIGANIANVIPGTGPDLGLVSQSISEHWVIPFTSSSPDSGSLDVGNRVTFGSTGSSSNIDFADFMGNSTTDIFVTNDSGNANTFWIQDSNGNLSDSGAQIGSANTTDVIFEDVNADKHPEAIVSIEGKNNAIWEIDNQTPNPGVKSLSGSGVLTFSTKPSVNLLLEQNSTTDPDHLESDLGPYEWYAGGSKIGSGKTYSETINDLSSHKLSYGNNSAELRVTDPSDETGTKSFTIRLNDAPSASLAAITPNPAILSDTIKLDATSSDDPNQSLSDSNFSWEIKRPGSETSFQTLAVSGPSVDYSLSNESKVGSYKFRVTVTDEFGKTSTATQTLTVENTEPKADFDIKVPNNAQTGRRIELDASSTSDLEDGTIHENKHTWSFKQDPSEGSDTFVRNNCRSTAFVPSKASTYEIKLTVTDSHGKTDSATDTIEISNPGPTAVAKKPAKKWVGIQLELDGRSSSDPNGSLAKHRCGGGESGDYAADEICTVSLRDLTDTSNCGSVTWSLVEFPKGAATPSNPNDIASKYTPNKAGTYKFELKVTDAQGKTDTDTISFEVETPAFDFNKTLSGATDSAPAAVQPSNTTSRGIGTGDVNGDDLIDIVFANTASDSRKGAPNQVLVAQKDGSYRHKQALGSARTEDVGLADLDGDGILDLFAANAPVECPEREEEGEESSSDCTSTQGANRIWMGNGDGTFTRTDQKLGTSHSRSVSLDTIDNNDSIDAAVTNAKTGGQGNTVWRNPGDGNFERFRPSSPQSIGNERSYEGQLADVMGDDTLEWIVVNTTSKDRVYTQTSPGIFAIHSKFDNSGTDTSASRGLDVLDLNGDGNLDVVTTASSNAVPNNLYKNDGNGSFSAFSSLPAQLDSGLIGYGVSSGDLDEDQDKEIAIASNGTGGSPGGPNRFWVRTSSSSFSESVLSSNAPERLSYDIELIDLDADTHLDYVAANRRNNEVWLNPYNKDPRADIELPDVVEVGESVRLNGSGSSDLESDYGELSFVWRFEQTPAGSSASIENPNSGVGSFVPQVSGEFTVSLSVTDGDGDGAVIEDSFFANQSPEIDVGQQSYEANTGESVSFDVAIQDAEDGSAGNLDINWSVQPPSNASSNSYELTNANSEDAVFSATQGGTYSVTVQATDSNGSTVEKSFTVNVNFDPEVAIEAGSDVVNSGDSVTIDMSGSSDPNGNQLSYSYNVQKKPAGSSLSLAGETSNVIDVAATTPGEYVVQGVVTDENGASDSGLVNWTVNAQPNADFEVSIPNSDLDKANIAELGDLVQFDGSASSDDIRSDELTYTWSLDAPQSSQASLRTNSGRTTSLRAQSPGSFTVVLKVEDAFGLSDTKKVEITYNTVPTASIKAVNNVVKAGSTVPLQAQNSSDPQDAFGALSFQWTLISTPPASSAQIANATSATAQLQTDKSGRYSVKLAVTDSVGSVAETTMNFRADAKPVADIARDSVEANQKDTIRLDATGSDDEETSASALSLKWNFKTTPSGATNLPELEGSTPSFTLETPGEYTLELTVEDSNQFTATDTVDLAINGVPEFVSPTPDEDEPIETTIGSKVTFQVKAKDADNDSVQIEFVRDDDTPEDATFENGKFEWDATIDDRDDRTFEFRATDGQASVTTTVNVVFYDEAFGGGGASSPESPSCGNVDCGDGEVCHFGTCFESCQGDSVCSGNKTCLDGERCASDPCDRISCGENQRCYRGSCFDNCEDTCTGDDKQCIDGRCTENACADVQCPESQTCYQGSCFSQCEGSDDCGADSQCVEGRCTTDPCKGVQCPENQSCYQGSCFNDCESDDDCSGDNQSCVEGRCTSSACEGVQCPEGEKCFQGQCVGEDDNEDGSEDGSGESEESANRGSQGCGCGVSEQNPGTPWPAGLGLVIAVLGLVRFRRRRDN